MDVSKHHPSYTIFSPLVKKGAVFLKNGFVKWGSKIVFVKKLNTRVSVQTVLQFKTGEHELIKKLFIELMKKSVYPTDFIDTLMPEDSFDEFVLNGNSKLNFTVYDNEGCVGYCCLNVIDYKGIYGTINHIGILKHGRGYALECLKHAQNIFIEMGIKEYRGSTDSENIPMIRTFEKFGCRKKSVLAQYVKKP